MILDSLDNLSGYVFSPYISQIVQWLENTDLNKIQYGKHILKGDFLYVNCDWQDARLKESVSLETHRKYIDVQIPLSGDELMGYTPASMLDTVICPYDESRDAAFYKAPAQNYFLVRKGMFAVFFPGEGHAPAISDKGIRKLVFKLKI